MDDGGVVRLADSTDYVGIGTTTPTEKLEVNGDIKVKNIRMSESVLSDPASHHIIIDADNNSSSEFFSVRKDGDNVGSSAELVRIQENGNVGIGTISPVSRLHVMDNIRIQGATGSSFLFMDAPTGNVSKIAFYEGGAGPKAHITYHPSYSDLMLGHGGASSDLVIKYDGPTTGNVGIGTAGPTEKLHLFGGHIRIEDGTQAPNYVLTSDIYGVGTWQPAVGGSDTDWDVVVDVLYTHGQWGIARNGNTLWGSNDNTHINLGVTSTTGISGGNNAYCRRWIEQHRQR